jgi:hypothetical protein
MMLRASTLNFHPSHSMRTDGMPSVDSISRAVPMANNSLSANAIGKSDMAAGRVLRCERPLAIPAAAMCVDVLTVESAHSK